MLDRVRLWVDRTVHRDEAGSAGQRRHVTRREKELQQRRLLYIVTGVAAAIVVGALAIGALYQYWIYPNEAFATVNGTKIKRTDYEKFRKFELLQDIATLNQQLQFATEDNRTQLQQQIAIAQAEFQELETGDGPINAETLKAMVDDQLVVQGLDEFDITLTDEEIENYAAELVAPSPLSEPTATTTIQPTAAAWATETTEAFIEQSTATSIASATAAEEAAVASATSAAQTAEIVGTPTPDPNAPTATATAEGTGTAEVTGTAEASGTAATTGTAEASGTPEATGTAGATGTADGTQTPEATAEPTATLSFDAARQTADANLALLESNILEQAGMNLNDFERLIAEPLLARQRITEVLSNEVGATAEQVNAAHILVATEDAALEALNRLNSGEDFAALAAEVSIDTSNNENGGDLGWVPRGIMVSEFEEALFSQEVGTVSAVPVRTEFGWHIIWVKEKEADRPLTVSSLETVKSSKFNTWLTDQRAAADISSKVELPPDGQAPPLPQQQVP